MVANIGKSTVYARTSCGSALNVTGPRLVDNDHSEDYAGFQRVKESNRKILFEVDLKYTIEYVSPDINSLLGYDPQEVIGKKFSNFVVLSDLPDADRILGSVITDGTMEQLKVRVKSKDRKTITLIVKLFPIMREQNVEAIYGIAHVIGFSKE
ncbi:MAG: PAS domain-containing protein [Desulfobacterales bacterium]|jgi:PAS domain S-box-containing protein